jgi:hypothetical protein
MLTVGWADFEQITFVASGLALKFHVTVSNDANEPHKLRAECLGELDMHATISRCLEVRPNANDLEFLLVGWIGYLYMVRDADERCAGYDLCL